MNCCYTYEEGKRKEFLYQKNFWGLSDQSGVKEHKEKYQRVCLDSIKVYLALKELHYVKCLVG